VKRKRTRTRTRTTWKTKVFNSPLFGVSQVDQERRERSLKRKGGGLRGVLSGSPICSQDLICPLHEIYNLRFPNPGPIWSYCLGDHMLAI
jgi:hypothetical protein